VLCGCVVFVLCCVSGGCGVLVGVCWWGCVGWWCLGGCGVWCGGAGGVGAGGVGVVWVWVGCGCVGHTL
jgi:hypothetical protein